MKMYAVIRTFRGKEDVVDFRKTEYEAIIICACYNTKRTSDEEAYFIKEFKQPEFETKLDEKINNVYKIQVSFKNLEIRRFISLKYVFGENNQIGVYRDVYNRYAQLVRTYEYTEDESKIKTEMYNDVCDYIKKQKEIEKRIFKLEE